jgi:hypothetical protein
MQDVLETYSQPYDPDFPVACTDEQPIQLLKETRTLIAASEAHGRRVDYEYEHAGTAKIFMFTEPRAAWRDGPRGHDESRLGAGNSPAARGSLRTLHAGCPGLRRSQHTYQGALYEALNPERAHRLVRRIEFRHTPNHGSWLIIAENELSSMTHRCIDGRRFDDVAALRKESRA